jgi:N-acylneuraminate cytidylyltransferase
MSDGALALIPARGGSKGIPRRNVIEIAGKPLESTRVTRVVVDIVVATAQDRLILDRLTARPAPGSATHDG